MIWVRKIRAKKFQISSLTQTYLSELTEENESSPEIAQAPSVTVIENSSLEVLGLENKPEVISREDIDLLVLQTLFLTRFLVDK